MRIFEESLKDPCEDLAKVFARILKDLMRIFEES